MQNIVSFYPIKTFVWNGESLHLKVKDSTNLHLFIGCDSTEDNLREALSGKHPKTDASDDAAIFNKG